MAPIRIHILLPPVPTPKHHRPFPHARLEDDVQPSTSTRLDSELVEVIDVCPQRTAVDFILDFEGVDGLVYRTRATWPR
jgi:hypothetical protein